jgi:hypothetical protein
VTKFANHRIEITKALKVILVFEKIGKMMKKFCKNWEKRRKFAENFHNSNYKSLNVDFFFHFFQNVL